MKSFFIIFSGLIFLLLMTGCSTTQISTANANHIPSSEHFSYKKPNQNTGKVLVKRDEGIMGMACDTKIYVNGQLAAHVGTGEKVYLHIPLGEAILGAEPEGICAGGLIELETRVTKERVKAYRIGMDHTGSMGFYRTVDERYKGYTRLKNKSKQKKSKLQKSTYKTYTSKNTKIYSKTPQKYKNTANVVIDNSVGYDIQNIEFFRGKKDKVLIDATSNTLVLPIKDFKRSRFTNLPPELIRQLDEIYDELAKGN